MQQFVKEAGLVVPLDRSNVDTDQIIPKQYLKSIKRSGFGVNLFDDWRYMEPGEPGMDHAARSLNPDFVLNDPRYAEPAFYWLAIILGVDQAANMRPGRFSNMVLRQ